MSTKFLAKFINMSKFDNVKSWSFEDFIFHQITSNEEIGQLVHRPKTHWAIGCKREPKCVVILQPN